MKKFINLIKSSFKNIYNELDDKIKIIFNNFINGNKYDIMKEKEFNKLYEYIYLIIKDINNSGIYKSIFYPFTSGINYLNFLYHLCQSNEDFNKLINLILEISPKKEIQNKVCISELCLIDHMIYTFRKMNSSKKKGNYEINYCILLIKNILPKIINGKINKQIIKILNYGYNYNMKNRFKNGLINNIKFNPNLDFEKKVEILSLINETTYGISEQ